MSPQKERSECSRKFVGIDTWEILNSLGTSRLQLPGRLHLLLSRPFLVERFFFPWPTGEEGALPLTDDQRQPLEESIKQQKCLMNCSIHS